MYMILMLPLFKRVVL